MGICGSKSASAQLDRQAHGQASFRGTSAADDCVDFIAQDEGLTSKVSLSIQCKQLANKDLIGKSDPMCVVQERVGGTWREVARTEVIHDNLNPVFVKQLRLTYRFEEVQELKFSLFDVDTSGPASTSSTLSLHGHDPLGEATTTLADIMGARGQMITLPIQHGKGTITIRGEEMVNVRICFCLAYLLQMNALVALNLAARQLDNKDTFGKSDPFVVISRMNEDETFTRVFRSEVIDNNLNPAWKQREIRLQTLNNGDMMRPLRLEVFDWDSDGTHELIGGCQVNLDDLLRVQNSAEGVFPLINPEKQRKKKAYANSGELIVRQCVLVPRPSFLDYIAGGCSLNFTVAIDFTASNGNPLDSGSLHYFDPSGRVQNQYEQAIRGVGQVLEAYDSDKMFPTFGFGGCYDRQPVSHCFPLNGNPQSPSVYGVQGILEVYKQSLSRVRLSGPTLFSQILAESAAIAASTAITQQNQEYYVLLIITDGIINDMSQTISSIIGASDLPLSILIVGVGNANFSSMEQLDSDDKLLQSGGRVAKRDIVQFVPFNSFHGRGGGRALAKELLAEIPGQLLSFMASKGIAPNPRPAIYPQAIPVAQPYGASVVAPP